MLGGEADEKSDVDLLVDIDGSKKVGLQFFDWYRDLEVLLGQKTDVVANAERPEHTSNWRLIERINRKKVLIHERV